MIEAPQIEEWPEVFRCVCRRGKQSWRDEQGHYACGKCPIEYSPDPKQQAIVQRMANGEVRRVLSRDRAWARAEVGVKSVRLR